MDTVSCVPAHFEAQQQASPPHPSGRPMSVSMVCVYMCLSSCVGLCVGDKFWNRLSITPVLNEGGDLVSYIGVQSDVTELFRRKVRWEGCIGSHAVYCHCGKGW